MRSDSKRETTICLMIIKPNVTFQSNPLTNFTRLYSINIRGPGNMMGGPMGMQSDGYSNSGRGGMGSGGGAYGGQGPRGGYSGRGMQDNSDQMQQSYGGQQIQQQNYNMQQGYGGFRGGVSNVNGGNAGVRYPAGYGGTSAASGMNMGMNRGISGQGQGQGVYPNPQMYAQQSQPVGFYGYGFRYALPCLSDSY